MTPEQQMEQFSLAYVRAVAAAARVNVERPEVDTDSVDLRFSVKSVAGQLQSPILEAQVKSAAAKVGQAETIQFPLKIKNYAELIGQRLIPRILIVVVLPKKVTDWLTQDEEALVLRRCGYWLSLAGEPERDNRVSVTVAVPRAQVFSVEALQQFLKPGGQT